jgi:hypothetical protein
VIDNCLIVVKYVRMDETYISYRQAARICGVSSEAVRSWKANGRSKPDGSRVHLRTIRVVGRFYTTREWLAAFLAEFSPGREPIPQPVRRPVSVSLADRRKRAKQLNAKQANSVPHMPKPAHQNARPLSGMLVGLLLPNSHQERPHGSGRNLAGAGAAGVREDAFRLERCASDSARSN